jgi:hypothetical protein
MTYTIASVHEVMNASRGRIGHVIVSSRGFRAFDAAGALLGTYRTSEDAIAAISARQGDPGHKFGHISDVRNPKDQTTRAAADAEKA